MRRVIATVYATLDGYIDNPQEWSLSYATEDSGAFAFDLLRGCDALLMGRVTYEGFSQAWPSVPGEFADRINGMPKYVVSSTLGEVGWNATVLKGEVADEVAALKRQPGGDILMYGTGRLTDTLMEHGLLDEYHIWVYPVIKGKGDPLFRPGTSATLTPSGTRTFSSGVVVLSYQPQVS
ncbi:dihydrofolate reductase family protein [Nonomuraea sp. NPDC005983]|uniref:dihydrofolate reductase family protein n=1 Tax=Nonomuraea sp. NPDC005983 TaxID=3155595 RepID=UPI0033AE74F5